MLLQIDVVTIFPDLIRGALPYGVLGLALERGLLEVRAHNLRDWTTDAHRTTDDYPFGGGAGMVMKPEPLVAAVAALRERQLPDAPVILLSPQGATLTQARVQELAQRSGWIVLCGRYEGVDERVRELVVTDEVSIGDYVLSGGELAALVLIEAAARVLPGALGNEASALDESFSAGLVEYPQYTRPREWRGLAVPEVLLAGRHEEVRRWRRTQALRRTRERRPDLLATLALTAEDRELLVELEEEDEPWT
jgi:tRNA (guanine37-N1)-methyltransferase